jgi:uncharacterized membrane protein
MKRDETYKPIGEEAEKQTVEETKTEILAPLENDIAKLRDPLVLAALMHTAATERENTNRLLKTIIEMLERKFAEVEERIGAMEKANLPQGGAPKQEGEPLLPPVDMEIMAFVKEKGYVNAEEVRKKFGYKGKNAASSRLNHLYEMGLLEKKQVGRVVVFFAK